MRKLGFTAIALVLSVASGTMAEARPREVSFELQLQPTLEAERGAYEAAIQEAVLDVVDNFARWGYSLDARTLVRQAHVFSDLPTAKKVIAKSLGANPEAVPDTFGGLATSDQFFLASPGLYRVTWDKLYGAKNWDHRSYHRLMIHELTHTGHAQYAAKVLGDEEKMGASWFFEGFACYAAGQFAEAPALKRAEFADQLVQLEKGKKVGYVTFARMVRTLALKVPVPTLLRHAGDPGFPAPYLSLLD